MLTRLREERGSAIVTLAITLPLLLIIGTFAVDVGNWFTHKRHLQTQADAAALAGGSRFALPCSTNASDPFDVTTVNGKINATARDYAGPSATYTGPSPLTFLNPPEDLNAPYNTQVGGTPNSKIHVLLNSTQSYDQGGSDFSNGQPCDTNTNFIDVKITEKNLPWFFNLTGGSPISSVNVEARAKLYPVAEDKGFIPIGIPLPKIYKAQATIRWCGSGSPLTGNVPVKLVPLSAGQQTDPTMTLWGPDPNVYPAGIVPLSPPLNPGIKCTGTGTTDFGGPDVNVELSGSPLVTPTTGNCANRFVNCFDTVLIRDWKQAAAPSGETDPPGINNVQLIDLSCGPGSPYWSSDTFSTIPCGFGITANVDWGTLQNNTGFTATVTAHAGGGTANLAKPGSSWTGDWTGASGLSSGAAATINPDVDGFTLANVTLDWSYSWPHTGKKVKCTPASPCTGSVVVHRSQAADSSPIGKVVVTGPNGLPLDSFNGYPKNIGLTVGIQDNGFKVGQRSVLRNVESQGNGALDCDNGNNGHVLQEFLNGCTPRYGINSLQTGPWEPCPKQNALPANPPAWLCVPQLPGNKGPHIPSAFDAATGNCDAFNGGFNQCTTPICHNPSKYNDPSNPDHIFAADDPRVVKLFLVPFAGLKGITGSDTIEVVDFAAYYVTNWRGNPCDKPGGTEEKLPPSADAVGRFVKIVDPEGIPDPNRPCVPSSVTPCVVVLVR